MAPTQGRNDYTRCPCNRRLVKEREFPVASTDHVRSQDSRDRSHGTRGFFNNKGPTAGQNFAAEFDIKFQVTHIGNG